MKKTISCVLAVMLIVALFTAAACSSAKNLANDILQEQAETAVKSIDRFVDGEISGEEVIESLKTIVSAMEEAIENEDVKKVLSKDYSLNLKYSSFLTTLTLLDTDINLALIGDSLKEKNVIGDEDHSSYNADVIKTIVGLRNNLAEDYGLPVRESTP
jgi:hypothetical protein